MENKVLEYRKIKRWTQEQLADAINKVLEEKPDLKKITEKNPSGLIDQQTAQRLESGGISLDERWLKILGAIFDATPNDLLGVKDPLRQRYDAASDEERSAVNLILREKK